MWRNITLCGSLYEIFKWLGIELNSHDPLTLLQYSTWSSIMNIRREQQGIHTNGVYYVIV